MSTTLWVLYCLHKGAGRAARQAGNAHPSLVHNKIPQVDCSPIVHGRVEHSYYLWVTVNCDIRLVLENRNLTLLRVTVSGEEIQLNGF